jgi:hypothetical protein
MDKLVTLAKKGDLLPAARLSRKVRNEDAVRKLFDVFADRYKDRNGGYTRVLKAGFRHGDNAPVAVLEMVDRDESAKGAADKAATRLNSKLANNPRKEFSARKSKNPGVFLRGFLFLRLTLFLRSIIRRLHSATESSDELSVPKSDTEGRRPGSGTRSIPHGGCWIGLMVSPMA